ERAAREQVDEAEDVVRGLLEERLHRLAVDARRRDRDADAVHREHPRGEQEALFELLDAQRVRESGAHSTTSKLPPWLSIAARADLLAACARTVSFRSRVPSPRILIRSALRGARPAFVKASGSTTEPASKRFRL